jgi:guanylate kinase
MMDLKHEGKLVVVVAPSGSGKTTMARRLLQDFENLRFSVSATTRPPREGEQDGREYFFLSDAEFDERVSKGDFLEWETFYNGRRYGTLKPEVDRLLKKGYFILLDLEVNGAMNVKQIYGERCLAVFICPPSIEILKDRLSRRGTESPESVAIRLERVAYEMTFKDRFDSYVINDNLETAYREIHDKVQQFFD